MKVEVELNEEWVSDLVRRHLRDSLNLLVTPSLPPRTREDRAMYKKDIAALKQVIEFCGNPKYSIKGG